MKKITEEYNVSIEKNAETGQILSESWKNKEGVHEHPQKGHAAVRHFDPETGKVISEVWFKNGKPHRDGDRPAIINIDTYSDMIVCEGYYIDGDSHRICGPAYIERDPATGKITVEEWQQNGELYRNDGLPALIHRSRATNVITKEEYYAHGELHKVDAPALIYRDENTGEITHQSYYINGKELDKLPSDKPDPLDN